MNYIFVFLGEFGYELLNWQGVIRKFSKTIDRNNNKIICCTRKGLESFYEFADKYIDISELSYFKNSVANMYWAHNPDINCFKKHKEVTEGKLPWELFSKKDITYQNLMKKQIIEYVTDKLNIGLLEKIFKYNVKFIFSSDYQTINGLNFGTNNLSSPRIYSDLDINNNEFIKTLPTYKNIKEIEAKLGFSLNEKYILYQTGARQIVTRSKNTINEHEILDKISKEYNIKVVLLNFDTGRNLDSKSEFKINDFTTFNCNSFEEQSVLIANANACIFLTEGDFRSHNYIPPFMGKNVLSIAHKSVFELNTTPIDFWNKNVFKFGGQIIPIIYEKIGNTEEYEKILRQIETNI